MRHELKFVCEERAYPRVLAELAMLPEALRPQHEPRIVQSIYLDTPSGMALEDNLAGIAERKKLRFRWYGAATTQVQGHLEEKRRHAGLGDKSLFALPEPLQVAGASRVAFVAALRRQLPPAWRMQLDGREPAQWIRYRRDYLASADGRVRVTLDRDLAAFDLRYDFVLGCTRPTPLPRILVVEVKAPDTERSEVERLLQGLGLVAARCSKFVLASSPADGPFVSHVGE